MRLIAIEGCIGAGKTTVAQLLAKSIGAQLLLEQFGWNPFLEKFYEEPPRYALETELSFILIHYHQLRESLRNGIATPVVSDFCFAKDKIFCDLNLAGEEAEAFHSLYDFLTERLEQPDIVVCLHCTDDLLLDRIEKRKRDSEVATSHTYFRKLNAAYEQFFEDLLIPRIDVNMSERDFLNDDKHINWLVEEIMKIMI